jgi:hypothetical protein
MQERNLKEDLQKKEESTIKQKMELLYEEILDELLVNQKSLTKTERVKLFVTLSNYIFPKTKSVRDQFTLDKLKEIDSQGFFDKERDPTK